MQKFLLIGSYFPPILYIIKVNIIMVTFSSGISKVLYQSKIFLK